MIIVVISGCEKESPTPDIIVGDQDNYAIETKDGITIYTEDGVIAVMKSEDEEILFLLSGIDSLNNDIYNGYTIPDGYRIPTQDQCSLMLLYVKKVQEINPDKTYGIKFETPTMSEWYYGVDDQDVLLWCIFGQSIIQCTGEYYDPQFVKPFDKSRPRNLRLVRIIKF